MPEPARRPADDLATALAGLFPPTVASALTATDDEAPSYPEEQVLVAGAADQRRREFLAGRAAAHAALRSIGRDDAAIGRGTDREPLWPPGVVGSISHAGGIAAAVAARADDAWGVGVDIETLEPPLDPRVERLVVGRDEPGPSPPGHPLAPYATKVVFCAKECVFKCVFPPTRWRLGFHDLRVSLHWDAGRYRATVDDRFRLDGRPLRPLEGGFTIAAGYVVAGLWLGPDGPAVTEPGDVGG